MVDSTRKEQFFCSICNTERGTVLFSAPEFDSGTGSYQIYQCSNCLLIQTQPTPTKQALTEAYNENYYGGPASKFKFVVEQWTLFAARKRARRLLKIHGQQAQMLRILDIGCGRGVLLNALRDLGQHVTGLERIDSPFIDLPDIIGGEITDLAVEHGRFDVIILWQVLEHLETPDKTLDHIYKLLNSEGSLFISVPNFASNQARIFGKHWFHLDIPRHLFHFSQESLEQLLRNSKLEITRKNTLSLDQNIFGFIQSTLNMIPGLNSNHFYKLLKSGISLKSLFLLFLYLPLITTISIIALAELIISELFDRGASLTIQAIKDTND